MKTISENENAKKRERKMWIQVKINHEESCKNIIDTLIKKKRLFHMTREFVFANCQSLLKASPSTDTIGWRESTNKFQEKAKILAAEIAECEWKLKEKLWIADLSLRTILDEKKHNKNESAPTVAMLKDLNTLKEDVSTLKMNNEISVPYTDFEYPTSQTKEDINCTEENDLTFKAIQEKMAEEKNRDAEINRKIKIQYNKIADTSHKVMKHNKYTYTQSWYTGIVNVVGLLTGVGLVTGLCNKIDGGHFFMWEKTPSLDLHHREWNALRESATILGASKKR
jgi:hypothetical protein